MTEHYALPGNFMPSIEFRDSDNKILGTLSVTIDGILRFSGEVEPCGMLFLEFLNEYGILVGKKQPLTGEPREGPETL